MRFISAAVLGVVLLAGCDGNSATSSDTTTTQAVTAPVLDEASILKESGFTTVRRYDLEDGHGFYIQESPDAAIEFRDNRINVALRTFPEAGYEAKNATANGIAKKLVGVITGTDGQLVDDVIAGEIKPGKQFINGLPVNVSGMEHDWIITVNK